MDARIDWVEGGLREAALPVWALLGAPDAVGLFNHGQGHAFPGSSLSRSREWLGWFLRGR